MGKLFFIIVAIVLPIFFFVYALYQKRVGPFVLGVMAFVLSQMMIRIPLLNVVADKSSMYQYWSATKPLLILLLLAGSAGIVEELARWILMQSLLKSKTLHNGIVFGLGHGGIEAFLLVGIPIAINALYIAQPFHLFLSGLERLCAMSIHVCLSVLVLTGIRKGAFRYCLYAIIGHSAINFISGALASTQSAVVVEMTLVFLTFSLVFCTVLMVRRNFYDEKMAGHYL